MENIYIFNMFFWIQSTLKIQKVTCSFIHSLFCVLKVCFRTEQQVYMSVIEVLYAKRYMFLYVDASNYVIINRIEWLLYLMDSLIFHLHCAHVYNY